MFGVLQHRTFPIFFMLSEVMSAVLLVLWTLGHPEVILSWSNPFQEDVAQAWALAIVLLAQGLNDWVVGPLTSKTMFQRHKLEKAEGKSYTDEGVTSVFYSFHKLKESLTISFSLNQVSEEMKALTKRFGMLHGISSLLSLFAVIALAFHGLWLGNVGLNSV